MKLSKKSGGKLNDTNSRNSSRKQASKYNDHSSNSRLRGVINNSIGSGKSRGGNKSQSYQSISGYNTSVDNKKTININESGNLSGNLGDKSSYIRSLANRSN